MPSRVTDPTYVKHLGRTYCEVHREIYDILHDKLSHVDQFDELVEKLEEAYQYGKKMDTKLRQYKNNYDDTWWEKERAEIVQDKLANRRKR